MSPKSSTITIRIEPDQFERLERNRLAYGTPYSEQARRALSEWLARGGLTTDGGKAPQTVDVAVLRPLDRALREWDRAYPDGPTDEFVERVRALRAKMQPPDNEPASPELEAAREKVRKAPRRK